MPGLDEATLTYMALREDCKRFRCLPFPGALSQQPAGVMRMFRAYDGAVAEVEAERADKQRRDAEYDRLRGMMPKHG